MTYENSDSALWAELEIEAVKLEAKLDELTPEQWDHYRETGELPEEDASEQHLLDRASQAGYDD